MDPGDARSQKRTPEQVARAEAGIGKGLLGFTVVAVIASFVLLTFGLAPVALLIVALIPVAWLGSRLVRHGSLRLQRLSDRERRRPPA
jgi:hypothetical protein